MGGSVKSIVGRHVDPLNIFSSVWEDDDEPDVSSPETTSTAAITQTPTEADASVALAAADERRKRRAVPETILTSGLGVSGVANTDKKTLG